MEFLELGSLANIMQPYYKMIKIAVRGEGVFKNDLTDQREQFQKPAELAYYVVPNHRSPYVLNFYVWPIHPVTLFGLHIYAWPVYWTPALSMMPWKIEATPDAKT